MFSILVLLFYFGGSSSWSVQTSGLDTNLRGVSVTCDSKKRPCVVWASGSNGVILRSTDDGKTWKRFSVADGSDLDFRDIEAFDANTAYLMSSGDGDKSRIYKTTDGGESWKLQYSNKRVGFFLDSLACDSPIHCVALSDPVESKFLILITDDGEHWKEISRNNMPTALPQEGAFAASGTAISLCDGKIFFGTGGPSARIFSSNDYGRSWTVINTPIISGNPSSGVFSVACSGSSLVIVGGDYKDPNRAVQVAAYSNDSGKNWRLSQVQPGGYRSAVASFSDHNLVAVGPNGTNVSWDNGVRWQPLDSLGFNAASVSENEIWAVGVKGTIARSTSNFSMR